jgi:hypothetical protein
MKIKEEYNTESFDPDYYEEEEAFWIFTMMIESLVPLDYYSNLIGTLID